MSSKKPNLTDGITVTNKIVSCFAYIDAAGCMRQGVKCVEPNPDDPQKPIVTYEVNGEEIPKPDKTYACMEPGVTQPVYVMGGKLSGEADNLEELLTSILEEVKKDTPFNKTRYCKDGTWWEKLCVIEKDEAGQYVPIVVSDEDTFEPCDVIVTQGSICIKEDN